MLTDLDRNDYGHPCDFCKTPSPPNGVRLKILTPQSHWWLCEVCRELPLKAVDEDPVSTLTKHVHRVANDLVRRFEVELDRLKPQD